MRHGSRVKVSNTVNSTATCQVAVPSLTRARLAALCRVAVLCLIRAELTYMLTITLIPAGPQSSGIPGRGEEGGARVRSTAQG